MSDRERLKDHIDAHLEAKERAWAGMRADDGFKGYLRDCVGKWRRLFHDVFLRDERFLSIAEPVTESTPIDPCQYFMRTDGSIVFTEATLRDDKGDMICGYPLRFPYEARAARGYASDKIEPDIFGIPMKCCTTVFRRGRKDYGLQVAECMKVVENQRGTRFPILPLYFHADCVNGRHVRIVQTNVFRRENFVVHFPFRKAMAYSREAIRFEPVVKGAAWLLEEAHRLDFASFRPLALENLGVTGSSAFGDVNDKEDFDVVLLDDRENLRRFRDFLFEGVRRRLFTPVSASRKLRVYLPFVPVECNEGKPLLLCSFLNLADIASDPLYRARFRILDTIDAFDASVLDDSENMLTPPRVVVGEYWNVPPQDREKLTGPMPFIPMMGTSRGSYEKGMRLRARGCLLVEFTPARADPFRAIVSVGWYDTEII